MNPVRNLPWYSIRGKEVIIMQDKKVSSGVNSKIKFLAAFVLIFGVVLLTGAGCAKKPVSPASTPKGEGAPAVEQPASTPSPAKEGDIGKMTDDIYVEITAQMNYSLGKGELKYAGDEGFVDLLNEHGVSKADFEAFNTALTADPARSASLGVKIMQRLKEISK